MSSGSFVGLYEDLTQPEILLPQQFRQMWHASAAATPVQRLAMAMLMRTILDLSKYRFAKRLRYQKLYADAWTWVFTRREDPEGLSFTRICESFGIDPDAARRELAELGMPDQEDRLRTVEWEEAA
jgi:hypothetical protein